MSRTCPAPSRTPFLFACAIKRTRNDVDPHAVRIHLLAKDPRQATRPLVVTDFFLAGLRVVIVKEWPKDEGCRGMSSIRPLRCRMVACRNVRVLHRPRWQDGRTVAQ